MIARRNPFGVVSPAALIKRIKRRLAARGEMLVRTRPRRPRFDLGDYYVVDVALNIPIEIDVDLEDLGRELGALAPYERVAISGTESTRHVGDAVDALGPPPHGSPESARMRPSLASRGVPTQRGGCR